MAKKQRIIYLDDEIYEKIQAVYKIKNFRSISEFVDTAIKEWFARDAGQEASMYMSRQLVSLVENSIRQSEQRINRILYKLAVGDAELKYVVAIGSKFNKMELLPKIHEKSEREVRTTNGVLSLKTIIEQENGDGGVDEWHD